MQSGVDSPAALEKVYGKTVAAVEKDLQSYYRGNQFFGRLYPVKLATSREAFPASSAPLFDVKLALADLTNRHGSESSDPQGVRRPCARGSQTAGAMG